MCSFLITYTLRISINMVSSLGLDGLEHIKFTLAKYRQFAQIFPLKHVTYISNNAETHFNWRN